MKRIISITINDGENHIEFAGTFDEIMNLFRALVGPNGTVKDLFHILTSEKN